MRQQYGKKGRDNKVEEKVPHSLGLKKPCLYSSLLTYLYLLQNDIFCIKN